MRFAPLNNTVRSQLAEIHGSDDQARAFRRRDMAAAKPQTLEGGESITSRTILISDLHMNAGRDPVSGNYYEGEDFRAEQERELIAYLSKEWLAAAKGNTALLHPTMATIVSSLVQLNWADGSPIDIKKLADIVGNGKYSFTLCINGDFVDFLRTTSQRADAKYPDGFDKHGAPMHTPANTLVTLNTIRTGHPEIFRLLAVHLALGHKLDIIPGNHDKQLLNPIVWNGELTLENGKKVVGFRKVVEQEIRALKLPEDQVQAALSRMNLKPFTVYADAWVGHGHEADKFNLTQRPWKEAIEPTPMHSEMERAYGDWGVSGGFNKLDETAPGLDAIDDSKMFFQYASKHPREFLVFASSFIRGMEKGGYKVSPEADRAQRMADLAKVVERFPSIVESINAQRPEGEKLSKQEVIAGMQEIEKVSATPLFSNYKAGQNMFQRLFSLASRLVRGKIDNRDKNNINIERGLVAQREFGVNFNFQGHTHQAKNRPVIGEEGKQFRFIDEHTWMTKVGSWGRANQTWGQDGRGVGVIEEGLTATGERWTDGRLQKSVNDRGDLVEGDLLEMTDPNPKGTAALVEEFYKTNHLLEKAEIFEEQRAAKAAAAPAAANAKTPAAV